MTIHRVVIDFAGPHKSGLETHNAELAERWSREAAHNAKRCGAMVNPFVVDFDPTQGGHPVQAAMRVLRAIGADCSMRTDGMIEVRNPTDSARRVVARLGLDVHADSSGLMELHAPKGESHGLDIVRSLHRLHADILRKSDGSIEVRNLYHYPERSADDVPNSENDFSSQHPSLTKRQWVKIPQVASKRHCIVSQPENKS